MRGRQPRTYKQAIVWAALVVGIPLAGSTILNAVTDGISWTAVFLNLVLWLVISALLALAFSGGVKPRRDREEESD